MKQARPSKLFFVIVGVVCLPLFGKQGAISFEHDRIPLKEAINQLMDRHSLNIAYHASLLESKKTEAYCDDCTAEQALTLLLSDFNITFNKVGKQYILRPGRIKLGSIRGRLLSMNGQEPVANARIFLERKDKKKRHLETVISDDLGSFQFNKLKPGTYAISIHSDFFTRQTASDIRIEGHETRDLVIDMQTPDMGRQVLVVVQKEDPFAKGINGGVQTYKRGNGTSGLVGGSNNFSSLSRMPGVSAHDWNTSDFSIKGSDAADTAVYLDGMLIETPSHFQANEGRSQGMIDVDALDSMEVISSGMPLQYGDGFGGILAMTTAAPTRPLEASVAVSTLETKARVAGTFAESRGSWFFNLRRTDWANADRFRHQPRGAASKHSDNNDILGKIQYILNESHVLSFHTLMGMSDYSYDNSQPHMEFRELSQSSSEESSRYSWLNLQSFWTSRLSSETILSYGQHRSNYLSRAKLTGIYERTIEESRDIHRYSLRQDWSLEYGKHEFKFGFVSTDGRGDIDFIDTNEYGEDFFGKVDEIQDLTSIAKRRTDIDNGTGGATGNGPGSHGNSTPEERIFTETQVVDMEPKDYGFYIGDNASVTDNLDAQFALRYDKQALTRGDQWSPRLTLRYSRTPETTLRLSLGRFYKNNGLHKIDFRNGQGNHINAAELSDQVVLSLEHQFPGSLLFSAEIYNRNYEYISQRSLDIESSYRDAQATTLLGTPSLEGISGLARGVEISLRQDREGPLKWNLNYTLSRAEDELDGHLVPRAWDRRHAVNAAVQWSYADQLDITATWQWHSGFSTTAVDLVYDQSSNRYQLQYGTPGAQELPDYQRIDIRLDKHIRLGKQRDFYCFVEITNITNHQNITGYQYKVGLDHNQTPYLNATAKDWDSLLPMIGMRWDF